MGRYRPARPRGTPLITEAGERRLREELELLWRIERPQVTQAVQDAARNGDRSENGDYIYGKKRLREIDSRVHFLRRRLEVLKVVRELPDDRERVFFGARISLVYDDQRERRVRIVGPDEFDTRREEISVDSPMARALIGKRLGDRVLVAAPGGEREVEIVSVDYDAG